VRARRGPALERADRRYLLGAAAVLALALAPPLLEQLLAREGNLTKLARFFADRREPLKPFAGALRDWTLATSWLPDRLLERSLLDEVEPGVMRSTAAPVTLSLTSFRATAGLVLASLAAAAFALRRRDSVSVALLGTGALACVLAVFALRAIVGVNYIYLLFWTTAGSTVLWMGVAASLATALRGLTAHASLGVARAAAALAIVVGLAGAYASASLQRGWLAKNTLSPPANVPMRDVYGALRARLATSGETPVIHAQGAWHIAMSFLLELSKDGIAARTVERDRWILGRQTKTAEGLAHPLHVYARTAFQVLDTAPCLRSLAISGDVELLISEIDVERCDVKPPSLR
jgi:hypothetical protein